MPPCQPAHPGEHHPPRHVAESAIGDQADRQKQAGSRRPAAPGKPCRPGKHCQQVGRLHHRGEGEAPGDRQDSLGQADAKRQQKIHERGFLDRVQRHAMGGDEVLQPAIHRNLAKPEKDGAGNGDDVGIALQRDAGGKNQAQPGQLPQDGDRPPAGVSSDGFAPRRRGASQPVDDDGQQHDDDAGGKRLSEACGPLVGGDEDLAPDIVEPADHGGDDDHRQAGQNQLVDADKDLLLGAGKLNIAEALPWCRSGHGRHLAKFLRHRLQPQQHIAGHWRRRIDHAGKNPGNRAEAEQHHQRREIGKGRDRLHQVQRGLKHRVGAP